MTILPVSSSPASQWQLSDYSSEFLSSDPAAGGLATVEFDQVPDSELWMLERASVFCDSETPTTFAFYLDQVDPARVLDYTNSGNSDVADESQPIQIPAGSILIGQWAGASAGAVGTVRVQYTILRNDR